MLFRLLGFEVCGCGTIFGGLVMLSFLLVVYS